MDVQRIILLLLLHATCLHSAFANCNGLRKMKCRKDEKCAWMKDGKSCLLRSDLTCNLFLEQNTCFNNEYMACFWVDKRCLLRPSSCDSFLRRISCLNNEFVPDCQWTNGLCSSRPTAHPTVHPTAHPTTQPSVMPTEGSVPFSTALPSSVPSIPSPTSIPSKKTGAPTLIHAKDPSSVPNFQPGDLLSVLPSTSAVPFDSQSYPPSTSITDAPSHSHAEDPSSAPSFQPSDLLSRPSDMLSELPSTYNSFGPSFLRSGPPSSSAEPTFSPSDPHSIHIEPSIFPSEPPSILTSQKDDTDQPTSSTMTFQRGNLTEIINDLGVKLSTGMSVRVIARANKNVEFANGSSDLLFHPMPDGSAIVPMKNGGYVYVSNSEMTEKRGGVYAVYFDKNGNTIDYKILLSNTTRNCSGGVTPWGTYVSCEEYANGQCWQVDPDPLGQYHLSPDITRLGGDGGNYESVAVDDRNPSMPIFYVTEDHEFGTLRKYTPPAMTHHNWGLLHEAGGKTEHLVLLPGNTFTWSSCDDVARFSQSVSFPNAEGIDFYNGKLLFVSKKRFMLYTLDLEKNTYTKSRTNGGLLGSGEFKDSPDQLVRNEGEFLYFTEDGGKTPGVYAIDSTGEKYVIFEAYDRKYDGDETTGLSFSPDGTKMYACFQDCGCEVSNEIDCGCLLEFSRKDGRSFDGSTLSLKYHSV